MEEHDAKALLDFATKGGRVCPMPKHWSKLWDQLSNCSLRKPGESKLPLPLILDCWHYSDDRDKSARFQEHLAWAITHGQIYAVKELLARLADDDWYYGVN